MDRYREGACTLGSLTLRDAACAYATERAMALIWKSVIYLCTGT